MARLAKEERDQQRQIGARIADAREARRLTQPVVAERVGVSLRAYQNWEAGETRVAWTNLPKLAQALGVTEDHILHGEETDEPASPILPTNLQTELAAIHRRLDELFDLVARVEEGQRLQEARAAVEMAEELARTEDTRRATRRSG